MYKRIRGLYYSLIGLVKRRTKSESHELYSTSSKNVTALYCKHYVYSNSIIVCRNGCRYRRCFWFHRIIEVICSQTRPIIYIAMTLNQTEWNGIPLNTKSISLFPLVAATLVEGNEPVSVLFPWT